MVYYSCNREGPEIEPLEVETMFREYMIKFIRNHQYYADGALETLDEDELRDIYERLIDWIG